MEDKATIQSIAQQCASAMSSMTHEGTGGPAQPVPAAESSQGLPDKRRMPPPRDPANGGA